MARWTPYLRTPLKPTEADRRRLEALAGQPLPDAYWSLVSAHQGEALEPDDLDAEEAPIHFGVLLLASSPEAVARAHASYCVEDCLRHAQERHPAGLFPFADDTGGNYWALDLRGGPASPAVVFIDHEEAGEDGVTPEADSFDAFMARALAG